MGQADRPGSEPNFELEMRVDAALALMRGEILRAMRKHAPMHSPHEGHSVIREELEELWQHVMADTGRTRAAKKEALQIAAMGLRYALDITTDEAMKAAEDAEIEANRP